MFVLLVCAIAVASATAQTKVKENAEGNYVSISDSAKKADQFTGKYFINAKGEKFPVYISSKGNLYYIKVSEKSGNPYRVYLKN